MKIPTQLRTLTGGQAELNVEEVSDVRELLGKIGAEHPELTERLLDDRGRSVDSSISMSARRMCASWTV